MCMGIFLCCRSCACRGKKVTAILTQFTLSQLLADLERLFPLKGGAEKWNPIFIVVDDEYHFKIFQKTLEKKIASFMVNLSSDISLQEIKKRKYTWSEYVGSKLARQILEATFNLSINEFVQGKIHPSILEKCFAPLNIHTIVESEKNSLNKICLDKLLSTINTEHFVKNTLTAIVEGHDKAKSSSILPKKTKEVIIQIEEKKIAPT